MVVQPMRVDLVEVIVPQGGGDYQVYQVGSNLLCHLDALRFLQLPEGTPCLPNDEQADAITAQGIDTLKKIDRTFLLQHVAPWGLRPGQLHFVIVPLDSESSVIYCAHRSSNPYRTREKMKRTFCSPSHSLNSGCPTSGVLLPKHHLPRRRRRLNSTLRKRARCIGSTVDDPTIVQPRRLCWMRLFASFAAISSLSTPLQRMSSVSPLSAHVHART